VTEKLKKLEELLPSIIIRKTKITKITPIIAKRS